MTARRTKKLNTYVLDASVAIKWFADEEGSLRARGYLRRHIAGDIHLAAPDLLLYEIGNALARGKKLEAQSVSDALLFIQTANIRLVPLSESVIIEATKLCEKYQLTFYDAAYFALAANLEVPLLSADTKSHGRIADLEVKIIP